MTSLRPIRKTTPQSTTPAMAPTDDAPVASVAGNFMILCGRDSENSKSI